MNNLMIASVLSMSGLAILFASILAFADKKLKVKENPKVLEVNNLLPGVNCGACGFLSCHDFAEHIANEGADPSKCRVVDEDTQCELFKLSGVEGGTRHPIIPLVHCAAEDEHKEPVAEYKGVRTCRSAKLNFGAGMQCEYGCMAFGDCTEVCPFDALHMENGLPRVDLEKCTGCSKCVEACPRGIIKMQDKKHKDLTYVACNSHDVILRVRQICKVGCIACGICEKLSPEKLFTMKDNLSYADYSKQDDSEKIGTIRSKCPTKVIKTI